jgi:hypothetical protein
MIGEGLFAFFQRDYPKAGAFMIPYWKACLRHVLEQLGEPTTVIKEGGVESNLMLSSLLGKHRATLEQAIPHNYTFAIEAIFDDPLGASRSATDLHMGCSAGATFSLRHAIRPVAYVLPDDHSNAWTVGRSGKGGYERLK